MSEEISRRKLGKTAAALAAAAAMGGVVKMQQAEGQSTTSAASQPASQPTTAGSADPRVAAIEATLGRELTDKQRRAILGDIKAVEARWTRARKYSIPPGTEPAIVFRITVHEADRAHDEVRHG